ncbi:unnamed protein product [Macrosiphum euphorbiae]|uniref:Retrotransposon gag domain-containing protein n=3 Tax=Macrosiphum euphorbiae TaxID=13131 RepID=A0AAV0YCS7_9HEMI|nr:unnamed protein product [Macrosiphum euphorbiae]
MHSAGKRITRPPLRYNPSLQYPSPILPATDFDLTMAGLEDEQQSPPIDSPPSLESLAQLVCNMNDAFNAQMETISRKFSELDTRMDELCARIDDNDSDVRVKFNQFQSSFNKDLITMQNDIFIEQQRSQESHKSITTTQRSFNDTIKALSDRVSLTEGQSARLAALENKFQYSITNSLPPTVSTNSQPVHHNSFNNCLTSTTFANPCQTQATAPLNISSFSVPKYNSSLPSRITSVQENVTLSNTSGIVLDYTKLTQYDGKLTPVHPEEFLEQAEQYFLTHTPLPDQVKINYIKERFIGDARLWYNTLLPSPSIYQDFLSLFRGHFWSNNQQRAIRNELYRPYFHRDNSSLQKHAMDWINRARFLRPPIDQPEMVDQLISHFSFNISVALRGLRITTTNELIQQLSHLQQSHSSSTQTNNQSNPPSQNQNQHSYNHSSGHNHQNRNHSQNQNQNSNFNGNQNRYIPRNSNYPRPQYNQTNPTQSAPEPSTSPLGN